MKSENTVAPPNIETTRMIKMPLNIPKHRQTFTHKNSMKSLHRNNTCSRDGSDPDARGWGVDKIIRDLRILGGMYDAQAKDDSDLMPLLIAWSGVQQHEDHHTHTARLSYKSIQ